MTRQQRTGAGFTVGLVFPPLWETSAPYLSTPALTAYLRANGVTVTQYDANMAFWKYLRRPAELGSIYRNAMADLDLVRRTARRFSGDALKLLTLEWTAGLSRSKFVDSVMSGRMHPEILGYLTRSYSTPVAMTSVEADKSTRENSNLSYHDVHYTRMSLSYAAEDSARLLAIAGDRTHNPYVEFYEKVAVSSLRKARPDLLGISVVSLSNVVPAFTLAHVARQALKGLPIVMGGPWVTQLRERIAALPALFDLVDYFVVHEGEKPLLELCRALSGGARQRLEAIDNLLFLKHGAVHPNRVRPVLDLNELPTPDFDGLPLDEYDETGRRPLLGSRGCYWAKCRFCSYVTVDPVYRTRDVGLVVDDMAKLKRQGARHISFADSALSPPRMKALAERLNQTKGKLIWDGFVRFEKAFLGSTLPLAAKAGFEMAFWGLETGSQRMQVMIDKCVDLAIAKRVLAKAHRAGIYNRVMVMYGFPGETLDDFRETCSFLRDTVGSFSAINLTRYAPESATQLGRDLLRAGEAEPVGDLSLGLAYPSRDLTDWQVLVDVLRHLNASTVQRSIGNLPT